MRLILAIFLSVLVSGSAIGDAYAQSQNCSALSRKIRQYERSSDFKNGRQNTQNIRLIAAEIKKWESQFVRAGCQRLVKNGRRLNSTCKSIGRKVNRLRKDYNALAAKVEKGQLIAQAREAALQQYARFGCSARTQNNSARQTERKSLFEHLFGGDDRISEDEFFGFNQDTYRTVCVRSCDGYYWPVSFSTITDNFYQDAGACEAQSTGENYQLYYYPNDGGSPETMIDLSGHRYSDAPFAFRFRREYDASCIVKPQSNFGLIKASADGDFSKAIITFGDDISFPLPRRDPRHVVEVEVAEANYIPLPRPRPNREGETGTSLIAIQTNDNWRTMIIGAKKVRLVGPDTPYVPKAEAKS